MDTWLPFVYQYAVMTVVFGGGLWLVGRGRDSEDTQIRAVRRWLVAGYLAFIAFHAFFQFVGPTLGRPHG